MQTSGWQAVKRKKKKKKAQQQPQPIRRGYQQTRSPANYNSSYRQSSCYRERTRTRQQPTYDETPNLGRTTVNELPLEILIHIFSFLKEKDCFSCSLVNKDFATAAKWHRRSIRVSRFKNYEDLVEAFPHLTSVVFDSCNTAIPFFKTCMMRLPYVHTLKLWNVQPKLFQDGKFPPDDSLWKRTVRKIVLDVVSISAVVDWNFDSVTELELCVPVGLDWTPLIASVSPTLQKLTIKGLQVLLETENCTYENFVDTICSCDHLDDLRIHNIDSREDIHAAVAKHWIPLFKHTNRVYFQWNDRRFTRLDGEANLEEQLGEQDADWLLVHHPQEGEETNNEYYNIVN
eukprot:TRINITY_DN6627_c0_g1_i1.p1 TRINITY_DN6627_c0_g1~~TRINITY_DN6627_c0_g1_i1.p1  ORF type:complete len:344 (-),score=60.80 TRINITY_DN6627_c0_g1_i1:25-1056(-)